MSLRFDCPLPWCIGGRDDHGGDGGDPSTWMHHSETDRVNEVASGNYYREGAGPLRYSVYLDYETHGGDPDELRHLADELAAAVAWLDERAAQLEQPEYEPQHARRRSDPTAPRS